MKPRHSIIWLLVAFSSVQAEPANAITDDDEYVIETSYSFQIAKNLELLTDIQYIKDPANDPTNDNVWVGGLRVIINL